MTSISAVTIDLNYKAGDYPKGKPWQKTYAPKPKARVVQEFLRMIPILRVMYRLQPSEPIFPEHYTLNPKPSSFQWPPFPHWTTKDSLIKNSVSPIPKIFGLSLQIFAWGSAEVFARFRVSGSRVKGLGFRGFYEKRLLRPEGYVKMPKP